MSAMNTIHGQQRMRVQITSLLRGRIKLPCETLRVLSGLSENWPGLGVFNILVPGTSPFPMIITCVKSIILDRITVCGTSQGGSKEGKREGRHITSTRSLG
jgi:hypothetical protein